MQVQYIHPIPLFPLAVELFIMPQGVAARGICMGGSRRGGGQFKETKKRSTIFLKPNQCSFSGHGLIDDYSYQQ